MIEDLFLGKTVALIGNSVILNSQEYGNLIDKHDVVCRINKGPLVCNPTTHGVRTDVLFYGDPGIILPEVPGVLTEEVIYVLTHFKFENRKQPKGKLYKLSRDTVDKIKFENGYIEKGKWPSNGFVAVSFILSCQPKNISLFGFDWKKNPTFYRIDEKGDTRHKYDVEESIIKSKKNIKVYE